jgi:nucleobase:cation symporter-1, NCS1 family
MINFSGAGDGDKEAWPLLRSERTWGSWRLAIALVTAAAATWCYLIGEYIGLYLGFFRGAMAMTAGSMVGMLLVLLAAGPPCIRYGIESIASTTPQFGSNGWAIPAVIQQLSIVCWNSMLLIFFSKSLAQLLATLRWLPEGIGSHEIVPVSTLIACTIIYLVLMRGAGGVTLISNILVAHVFVGFWMLYLLVSRRWPDILAARPTLAHADHIWNYTTGVEIALSSLLGWWAYIGAMIRMGSNGRAIVLPVMLGMGAPVPLLSLIGLAGVLVLKGSDPSMWLRTVGGPLYAIIALAFVTAANFGTAIAGVYASAIGLRNWRRLDIVAWRYLVLLTLVPVVLLGVFIPDLVFDRFETIVAFAGTAFAPLCGIQIADYYLLRHRRINIRGIFDRRPEGAYYYWKGVNPAAVIALVAGCGMYVYLLNPVTFQSRGPYEYLTASLPAALMAMCVYIAINVFIVMPAGRGNY